MKQRQRRFKQATRDLAQHSWWKSWTNSPFPLFGFNDAAPVSAEAWASLDKELRGRVDKKHPIFRDRGTPTYPRGDADNLANYLFTYGKEIAQ